MALNFANGLFPTDLCIFPRDFAQTNERTVRRLNMRFCRFQVQKFGGLSDQLLRASITILLIPTLPMMPVGLSK